ncbi:hypothetical protein [uncultured Prevotella sp.]|nr:hypothetical protein [uncultured Prevotella sp.]
MSHDTMHHIFQCNTAGMTKHMLQSNHPDESIPSELFLLHL